MDGRRGTGPAGVGRVQPPTNPTRDNKRKGEYEHRIGDDARNRPGNHSRYDQANRVVHPGQESQRAQGDHCQGNEGLFLHGGIDRQDKPDAGRIGSRARIHESHRENESLPGRSHHRVGCDGKDRRDSNSGDDHGTDPRSPLAIDAGAGRKVRAGQLHGFQRRPEREMEIRRIHFGRPESSR